MAANNYSPYEQGREMAYRFENKFGPVPREEEWCLAEFECQCGNVFKKKVRHGHFNRGYRPMDVTQSTCYRCQSRVVPARITHPSWHRQRTRGSLPHMYTGRNCYHRCNNAEERRFPHQALLYGAGSHGNMNRAEAEWQYRDRSPSGGQTGPQGSFKLQYKNGDLFRCEKTEALAHCVSRDMEMGKGIARTFKEMFGGVNELKSQRKDVGDVAILLADESYIYYLVTKERYYHKPTYETLQSSLEAMKKDLVEKDIRGLSMPKIGCGLDRLVWEEVEHMLYTVFSDTNLTITIYEYKT